MRLSQTHSCSPCFAVCGCARLALARPSSGGGEGGPSVAFAPAHRVASRLLALFPLPLSTASAFASCARLSERRTRLRAGSARRCATRLSRHGRPVALLAPTDLPRLARSLRVVILHTRPGHLDRATWFTHPLSGARASPSFNGLRLATYTARPQRLASRPSRRQLARAPSDDARPSYAFPVRRQHAVDAPTIRGPGTCALVAPCLGSSRTR